MNTVPFDMHELTELIDAVRGERITTEQIARLEDVLRRHDDARRYYLRAMRLQGYFEQNAVGIPPAGQAPVVAEMPLIRPAASTSRTVPRRRLPRWIAVASTLAACLIVVGWWAVSVVWKGPPQQGAGPRQQAVVLSPAWKIEPTGTAGFSIVDEAVVQLDRGELRVASVGNVPAANLLIRTPGGDVSASGTQFLVGYHRPTIQSKGKQAMFKPLTRVLVLTGVVTLTNVMGSVQGTGGDLLAAEDGSAPTKQVVQANSRFAFDLYRQLAKENQGKNLFFSPYSVSGALAMTAEGARGKTADEMGKVLCFPATARRVGNDAQRIPWETALMHTGISSINKQLMGDRDPAEDMATRARIVELRKELEAVKANMAQLKADRKWQEFSAARNKEREIAAKLHTAASLVDQYEIRVANALWGEKTYPFKKEFIETVHEHYDTGGVFPVDFRNAFDAARLEINGWVEEQTNERIKDIIPQGALDDTTRLVLTNAIYFKGEWTVPFKAEQTEDRDFTLAGGKTVKTAIMHAGNLEVGRYAAFNADGTQFNTPQKIRRGQNTGLYPGKDGFAAVELPYKGDDLSMVVIAPNSPGGLAALEANLTSKKVSGWVEQLAKRKVHVFLPKFKMETDYTLGDSNSPATLQAMGMVRAFNDPRNPATGADFSGMTTSTNPMDRLYISQVLHKAFVEVNEKGTEAAAATAVAMMAVRSAPITVPFTPTFSADRPFLFLIRDKATGSVLFLGRMTQPES